MLLSLLTIDHFFSNRNFVIELIQKHNEKNVKLKFKNMKSQLYVQLISRNEKLIVNIIENDDFREVTHLHNSNTKFQCF